MESRAHTQKRQENILDSIYNEDGDIDHEQVQNIVDGILSREYRISRLDRKGEKGRIRGSRLLLGSSLIIGGETRTGEKREARKQRNREEELLEAPGLTPYSLLAYRGRPAFNPQNAPKPT